MITYPPFKKMKFIIESPEHSKQIQEALFKLGYKWPTEGTTLAHFDKHYLFGDEDGDVLYSTSHHLGLAHYWENGTLQTLQTMIKEMEKPHMSTLKTNWAIRTTDEQFKAYIGTLESLGYEASCARLPSSQGTGRFNWLYKISNLLGVCRSVSINEEISQFPDISSFLVYHFSEEKTEAEKELEALQEKMNSLQEQIDRVKLSITK